MNGPRAEHGRRLLDEGLRLLDLAQATWPTAAGQAGTAGRQPLGQDANGHPGAECAVCPFCRGIAYLRQVDPQAVERVSGAVADVAAAMRNLFGVAAASEPTGAAGASRATAGPAGPAGHPGQDGSGGNGVPRVRVQQIDVTD